jgi:DNA repair exonuclease SbcCD ATPase subunit
MSCLEAVTISGFKNFSPHSYQTLEFTGPLTLITGKGGSGKSVKTLFT